MIKYANFYATNEWEYFLSKEVVNVKQSKQKNKIIRCKHCKIDRKTLKI